VGDHDHRHPLGAADVGDQRRHRRLVGDVEGVQRLAEQQQLRTVDEGLGDQQPLLLAVGARPDRPVRVGAGPDQCDRRGDAGGSFPAPPGPRPRQRDPPPVPVEAEPDEVDPPDRGRGVEGAPLGEVADRRVAPTHRLTEDRARPGGERHEAQQRLEEGGLTDPVGSQDGHELPGPDLEGHVLPHQSATPRRGPPAAPEPRRGGCCRRSRGARHRRRCLRRPRALPAGGVVPRRPVRRGVHRCGWAAGWSSRRRSPCRTAWPDTSPRRRDGGTPPG